jgi:hypothetical protein
MKRKEEARAGGALKEDEQVVSNFKDLYSRNKIVSLEHQSDEKDYGHEVDDFHGEL